MSPEELAARKKKSDRETVTLIVLVLVALVAGLAAGIVAGHRTGLQEGMELQHCQSLGGQMVDGQCARVTPLQLHIRPNE